MKNIEFDGIDNNLNDNFSLKALEDMSQEELIARLEVGYQQALRGEGRPFEEVFEEIEKDLLNNK